MELCTAWPFFSKLPFSSLLQQPGKRRWADPKGLSSVPHRFQRPTRTLRTEDQLGLYILCKVEAVNVTFLVDTGSNITILSPVVMKKISAQRRPTLEKVVNRMILADGSSKPFHGKGTFQLEVEGKQVQHEAWIADIELEGILGMDFVRQYGCQIISAPGGELRLHIPDLKNMPTAKTADETALSDYQCLRVAVGKTVVIPGNSEMVAKRYLAIVRRVV